ncbi:C39 family peptidase [Streptomyces coffeae]|uniref:C39 family peptidase n=1 Tax=Streptomyces coffeae TaxID=621382 RepID=A0ABS1N7K3_9ACTN|nr:C39 family peptidase [Streptomyces coffeae]MBL1095940.1 C39 family peptidase [Streptomyces coffeae]
MSAHAGDTSAESAAPPKAVVTHKAWQQKKSSWCVPASVQLSLQTFGTHVTQDSLAKQMKTNSTGTSAQYAVPVYNSYLNKKGYKLARSQSPTSAKLMDLVSYEVGVLHRAAMVGVNLKLASWAHTSTNINHAITVRGYDKNKGTFIIWDPSRNSYGGTHTVSAKNLATASRGNGLYYAVKN